MSSCDSSNVTGSFDVFYCTNGVPIHSKNYQQSTSVGSVTSLCPANNPHWALKAFICCLKQPAFLDPNSKRHTASHKAPVYLCNLSTCPHAGGGHNQVGRSLHQLHVASPMYMEVKLATITQNCMYAQMVGISTVCKESLQT